VIQFSQRYEELFSQVIAPVCDRHGIDAFRASDTFGPGIIIADIVRQISESALVIADISPANPNVYYEVGYAHALNKPTILLAESRTALPFDLSGFRTLFYEDTIAGKAKVEEGLEAHLLAIEDTWHG
jgi:nucleoside 2-deoxyribosyltransferase